MTGQTNEVFGEGGDIGARGERPNSSCNDSMLHDAARRVGVTGGVIYSVQIKVRIGEAVWVCGRV